MTRTTSSTATSERAQSASGSVRDRTRGISQQPVDHVVRPALTVIAQPVRELGATATQRVLERIAGADGLPEEVILRTSLINRASTGPAPVARSGGQIRA